MQGFVNSIQTLGALDGPGVRFTVFMQGCNLRCGCCHNPETWKIGTGKVYDAETLANKAERYREYFGAKGGITLTGGEPLLQAEFATELFGLCKNNGINTCLDTSGSIINASIIKLLDVTDRILLDIKYTDDEQYKMYVGCSIETPLEFLRIANAKEIPVTVRQVIIPTLNDNETNINNLVSIVKEHKCVDGIELLPFKKLCQVKYDNEDIPFRFSDYPTPTKEQMQKFNELIKKALE